MLPTLLAVAFMFTGVMHLVKPAPFVAIMPSVLPYPLELVYISGVAEIIGGGGLLVRRTRRAAAIWLIALLIAVFPANINMAMNAPKFGAFPEWLLWLRLPLQFVLIALVWRARSD